MLNRFNIIEINTQQLLTCKIETITPNSPMALPKISMINIFTKRLLLWASARAAPDPTIPTQTPHATLQIPTVSPAANIL